MSARGEMESCIGVDVGGTFTDMIFRDRAGRYRARKELTTRASPERAVLASVSAGLDGDDISSATYFVHGTTVALNALLERTNTAVGMLTTRGFRDVLEIRRGDRAEPYNLFWRPPEPLIPRMLRLPVTERLFADGRVETPLAKDDVHAALAVFEAHKIASIAIVFLHAYANPIHELVAHEILRKAGFTGDISLSHRVTGEFREYERSSTTTIDAYVRPHVGRYLRNLAQGLTERGFRGSALITRSGGGAITFSEADERAVETIMSGPVAGAHGAATLADLLKLPAVITADVGGTSFDTCLIRDGRPELMYEGQVAGLPVQTPWVDIRSIGAGGGSIAHVDVGGLLQVGPRSAGADPGPACYGLGGLDPTVTDAAFALGMLGEGKLAAGVSLDLEKAHVAMAPLCSVLGLSFEQFACGVMTIGTVAMANAIREITVERGEDPRDATLMAFGGAGPLFATLLARELEIRRVVIPPHAGNFSAWGLLQADLARTAARTRVMKLSDQALSEANHILEQLFEELESSDPATGASAVPSIGLDLRYRGQEHTLTVALATGAREITHDAGIVRNLFTAEYSRAFGHTMQEEVEIVHIRAGTRTPRSDPRPRTRPNSASGGDPAGIIHAYSFRESMRVPFKVIRRDTVDFGRALTGPVIILEPTATTYVDSGFSVRLDGTGCLLIDDQEAR